jgi:hypothetical protein
MEIDTGHKIRSKHDKFVLQNQELKPAVVVPCKITPCCTADVVTHLK